MKKFFLSCFMIGFTVLASAETPAPETTPVLPSSLSHDGRIKLELSQSDALIYVRKENSWEPIADLDIAVYFPELLGTNFKNSSIAISNDGSTLAIGIPNDNGGTGAVWVFTHVNGLWKLSTSKLVGTGTIGPAYQGYAVSLSSNGDTLAVGGPLDNASIGATWVFTREKNYWSQQGSKLILINQFRQGQSVVLNDKGDQLSVSAKSNLKKGFALFNLTWTEIN